MYIEEKKKESVHFCKYAKAVTEPLPDLDTGEVQQENWGILNSNILVTKMEGFFKFIQILAIVQMVLENYSEFG